LTPICVLISQKCAIPPWPFLSSSNSNNSLIPLSLPKPISHYRFIPRLHFCLCLLPPKPLPLHILPSLQPQFGQIEMCGGNKGAKMEEAIRSPWARGNSFWEFSATLPLPFPFLYVRHFGQIAGGQGNFLCASHKCATFWRVWPRHRKGGRRRIGRVWPKWI
jgi:hypothetical protein